MTVPARGLGQVCADAGQVDVLPTHVVMPRMSGPGLARRVKAFKPEARVVFMSGYPRLDAGGQDGRA